PSPGPTAVLNGKRPPKRVAIRRRIGVEPERASLEIRLQRDTRRPPHVERVQPSRRPVCRALCSVGIISPIAAAGDADEVVAGLGRLECQLRIAAFLLVQRNLTVIGSEHAQPALQASSGRLGADRGVDAVALVQLYLAQIDFVKIAQKMAGMGGLKGAE